MTQTIYIIGGTTEANRAVARLEGEGYRVVVSVATGLGEELSGAARVDAGSKDAAAMAAAATAAGASAILDCSHPYAAAATCEAQLAAAQAQIPYLRYTRPVSQPLGREAAYVSQAETVQSWEEAARRLSEIGERALLTIGTRNLSHFTAGAYGGAAPGFAVRILPMPESLAECLSQGISPRDIIAAHPPHSVDFNRACLRRARARLLITKDTGAEGGLPEKLEAARLEEAGVLMLARPAEPAGACHDLDSAVRRLGEVLTP